jgi:uncharacterized protein
MVRNQVGSVVRGNDFFGRDGFVRQVSEKLREGTHVLLAAPRRFGKTSIMYRLIDKPLWDYYVVQVDLEGLDHPAELVVRLLESVAKVNRLTNLVAGMGATAEKLASLVKSSAAEIEVFKFRVKLRDETAKDWREHLSSLMYRIASADQPVVFFLDELPMLLERLCRSEEGKKEAIDLMRWLRALRQAPNMHSLRFVLAGSIGIERILNNMGEIASINDFERMKLEPFPRMVAEQFLDSLAASYQFPLDPESRNEMLELIGPGVPYFLQVLFSELRKTCEEEKTSVSTSLVQSVYRDKVLGENCKTYFDHYYSRFRLYYQPHLERAAKCILRELASAGMMSRDACYQLYREAVGKEKEDFDEFAGMMTDLEYEFYVAFNTETRFYQFACKILRDWWLRHYAL